MAPECEGVRGDPERSSDRQKDVDVPAPPAIARQTRVRSPQQDKALSYLRDRRNQYGENPEASRKGVAAGKALAHRLNRRHEHLALQGTGHDVDSEAGEAAEQRLLARRPSRFRKVPDTPLGDVLKRREDQASTKPEDRSVDPA